MNIGEEKEIKVMLAPHTLESLGEAAKGKGMEPETFIRLVMNEWALRYEQIKNKKDR